MNSREVILWGVLIGICISVSIAFGVLSDKLILIAYSTLGAIIAFIALKMGSKGCYLIRGSRCYTILFFTIVVFICLLLASIVIVMLYGFFWFWANGWPAFNSFTLSPWVYALCGAFIVVIIETMIVMMTSELSMCPEWADCDGDCKDSTRMLKIMNN